jgi:signal transduction histidine kinase/CheY-like chemotaxis protein
MLAELAGQLGQLEARLAEREAALAGAMGRLEAEAGERRRLEGELRAASGELETARRLKGEFLASVSHDVRTPLNGILGMLHLLSSTGLTENQAEYAHGARDSALTLLSILNDILDLSRARAGRLSLVPAPFHPADLAEGLCARAESRARARGLGFSFRSGLAPGDRLLGDAERLRQILGSLLDAALKFSDGQELAVEVDSLPARLPDASPAARLIFAVRDGGLGLSPEHLPEFYRPGDQGDGPVPWRMGGVGLALARLLAGLLGAEVCLSGAPGLGSEAVFSLTLPLARPEEGTPILAPRRSGDQAPPAGVRILVAEDDPVAQLSITRILAAEGYGALGVSNGREALAALARERFDLVLMDIQMPVMNGVEATSAIRSGARGVLDRGVPIVALTAYALAGDRETFLAAGMDDYLTKPVVLDSLNSAIGRALARRRGGKGPDC